MAKTSGSPTNKSVPFKVPAYISALVNSVNDDAGKARSTALALLLTGLYLAATVIATTDEAMLRGSSREIPQIGVALPVVISYALAPLVFLFLHVSTLILFERVARKLQFYLAELRQTVPEADQAHCSNLLTGTAFVQSLARLSISDKGSGRRLFRFMSWLTVAGVPVAVLLAVQIDFVRYQQTTINLFQKTILVVDLVLLGWFYQQIIGRGKVDAKTLGGASSGQAGGGASTGVAPSSTKDAGGLRGLIRTATDRIGAWAPGPVQVLRRLRRAPGFLGTAAVALWLGIGHANVPGPTAESVGREANIRIKAKFVKYRKRVVVPQSILRGKNVLDEIFCPIMNWGCRYLKLSGRTLLEGTVEREVLMKLEDFAISGDAAEQHFYDTGTIQRRNLKSTLRQIDGLFLRRRTLRFADFTGTKLYRVDLIGADLRHATLTRARLQGAIMRRAVLEHADFREARLRGADLRGAVLERADLRRARLQLADLRNAKLKGADLTGARLQRADLRNARLKGVQLRGTRLQGADLRDALLLGADMRSARLQGADLRGAELQGADLSGANLQGANLKGAELQGADLRGAELQGADLKDTRMQGADLRGANLNGADLRDARLQGADLRFARLQGADLREFTIRGAFFSAGTDLSYANLRRESGAIQTDDEIAEAKRTGRGKLTNDDIVNFKLAMQGLDKKKRIFILAVFERRIGKNDNLPIAQLSGAYCVESFGSRCGIYRSNWQYYDALSASVLETLACDGVVEPVVARVMARRAMRTGNRLEGGKRVRSAHYWHLAKALHIEKGCRGFKHFTQVTIQQLREFTEQFKPKAD